MLRAAQAFLMLQNTGKLSSIPEIVPLYANGWLYALNGT